MTFSNQQHKAATDIVNIVLYDLRDRRGIRQAFEEIDEDVMMEIRATLIGKITMRLMEECPKKTQ